MHRPSGGARPQSSGGSRRNYTRNSNAAFKFHNFVFNEDNQSFCLEEQHGNKKITVLHWKKSELERSGSGGGGAGGASDGTPLSEEAEPEESHTTDSPPEIVTYGQAGKTISRQLSKTSSDSTSATKRRTHEVTTSASFPPLHAHRNSAVSTSVSSSAVPPLSSPLPPPPSPPVSSSHHHPQHSTSSPPTSVPSSHFLHPLSGDCSSPRLNSRIRYHPLSKSTASSSSIATSSSNSSSSAVAANWLNQSLHDLDLTELPYGSPRLPNSTPNSRRKTTQVRRIVVDDEDDDDESDRTDDELSDQEMMAADDSNLFCTYRRYLEQFDRKEQTQPLDLSVKNAMIDDNNNNTTATSRRSMEPHHWNMDSILGLKNPQSSFTKSESVDEIEKAFQSSRSEDVLSPSAMISSIKCCSPPVAGGHQHRTATTTANSSVNPFMLPGCSTDSSSVFSQFPSTPPTLRRHEQLSRIDELSHHHQQQSSSSYLFDAFLEEEISRLLQQSNAKSSPSSTASTTSTSSRIYHHPRTTTKAPQYEYEDIEERIEDKLRSLHREVLTRRAALERSSLGGNVAGSSGQEHLKLHFKLDAARNGNLELYGGEGGKTQSRTLSEPNLNQPSLSPFFSGRAGRAAGSQRNQIKRQLEDAFKQNGFLVKVRGGQSICSSTNSRALMIPNSQLSDEASERRQQLGHVLQVSPTSQVHTVLPKVMAESSARRGKQAMERLPSTKD